MKRIVPLFCLLLSLSYLSGCSLTPKETILKKPAPAAPEKAGEPVAETTITSALAEAFDSTSIYFSQAEALYSAGVQANHEPNWDTAQAKFEKALKILYLMDVNETDSATTDRFNRLLREIAYDYKNTLVYLGELDDDTSQILFLEQFYDLPTFKNQDFAVTSDSDNDEALEQDEFRPAQEPSQPVLVAQDFPVEGNYRVSRQMDYLTRDTRGRFQEYLRRSGKYIDLMREIVREKGLPQDLVYLPLIESGFNPKAYSWAHASGPWQFIASTGKKFGLERNWWYDERRDFVKSTAAACDYLKFLYGMFGDWKLALAAYNGGEGRVGRAIKRQRTDDFWRLDLRKQTEDYVPRFLAAVMIAKEPEKYGFYVDYHDPIRFETVEIKHCLDLKEVSRKLEVDITHLRELNPELLRDVTPPGFSRYQLRIPPGKSDLFWAHYQDLSSQAPAIFAQHRVRRGETLSRIAKKYGTSASALAELNGISTRKGLRAGQYLTVPVRTSGRSSSTSQVRSSPGLTSKQAPGSYFTYQVKREDSLTKLARKYRTTISAIRELNGFSARRHLYAGEKIRIPSSGDYASKNAIDRLTENLVIHVVQDGESLWKIAQSYGTSLANILAWNQLSAADNIRPGQRLKIYKN